PWWRSWSPRTAGGTGRPRGGTGGWAARPTRPAGAGPAGAGRRGSARARRVPAGATGRPAPGCSREPEPGVGEEAPAVLGGDRLDEPRGRGVVGDDGERVVVGDLRTLRQGHLADPPVGGEDVGAPDQPRVGLAELDLGE